MRMGSLFDGAGTCCFAAELCGIQSVWSSEIEKFPLEVTAKRFPKVKQLGDITKINGAEIEPVDIITFGSPCQDLSIAGKREGLDGERSGLFMEAIRIIKEMRNATANEFPRFVVWENVPGAYSSNQGEDFRTVLEEIVRVKDGSAVIPRPSGGGGKSTRWNRAGYILGRGYSLAWRTLDAQFWGVPQRRRRIYLVADFRGERADKILFERNGLSRNFKTVSQTWKDSSDVAENCAHNSGQCFDARGNGNGAIAPTITGDHENRVTDYTAVVVYNEETITSKTNASNPKNGDPCCTLCATGAERALLVIGAKPPVYCIQGNCIDRADTAGGNGKGVKEGVSYTLNTIDRHAVCYCGTDETYFSIEEEKSPTLKSRDYKCPNYVVYSEAYTLDSLASNSMKSKNPHSGIHKTEIARCLDTSVPDPSKNQGGNAICQITNARLIVRRLTPTECARLQGMPDWWAKDIKHNDSPEYKMWGNGMALPNILYVMEGLKEIAEEAA